MKGCTRCYEAGIEPEDIKRFLFSELEKLLGEIKSGERKRGMDAAKTFVARTGEYFDQSSQVNPASPDSLESSIANLANAMSC